MSTALRTYYRGHNLVAMRDDVAGQNRYYHFDHQGTTQVLTDSTGAVTDRFAADAWGVQVKRTGTSINRHWYVGRSGYYRQVDRLVDYVRQRFLATGQGRWLSRDRLSSDVNRYAYGRGSPAANVDPAGLQAVCAHLPDCTDACGNTLPCPRCDWKTPGVVHPLCTSTPCSTHQCEPWQQRGEILRRLLWVLRRGIGDACSGRQPLGAPPFRPWAITLCCERNGRCVGQTFCLECPPDVGGSPFDYSFSGQPGCAQDCLIEHEREHRRQCSRSRFPSEEIPEDARGRECYPYIQECRCLFEQARRISPTFDVEPCKSKCCGYPQDVEECLAWGAVLIRGGFSAVGAIHFW